MICIGYQEVDDMLGEDKGGKQETEFLLSRIDTQKGVIMINEFHQ